MAILFDRVKCYVLTQGQGALSCGPALTGNLGFSDQNVLNGTLVTYLLHDVGGAWEVGEGTYFNNYISRDNLIASSTGELLFLSGNGIISCQPAVQHFTPYEARSTDPIPKIADFTIQNISGGVTFTDTPGGILCQIPAGQGLAAASLFKPIPTGPCSVCVRFKQLVTMHQFSSFDLMGLNNSNGRLHGLEVSSRLNETSSQWQLGLFHYRNNSLSSFNATIYTQSITTYPLWYRFDYSSPNGLNSSYMSPDGYSWIGLGQDWMSNFVGTATHIGFGGSAANGPCSFLVSAFTTRLPV